MMQDIPPRGACIFSLVAHLHTRAARRTLGRRGFRAASLIAKWRLKLNLEHGRIARTASVPASPSLGSVVFAGTVRNVAGFTRIDATNDVLTPSHWFEMIRVDANRVAAQMVKDKPVWYRADQDLVSKPVGIAMPDIDRDEVPVANIGSGTRPFPATRLTSLNLPPELVTGRGAKDAQSLFRMAVAIPACVMHEAPTTVSGRFTTVGNATLREHRNQPFGVTRPDGYTSRALSFVTSIIRGVRCE